MICVNHKNLYHPRSNKKNDSQKMRAILILCPGLDSNQHAGEGTTTSKWLVYQFQHLGIPEKGLQM